MTKELLNKSIKLIESKLAKSEMKTSSVYWNYFSADFVFGNNRVATVYKNVPKKTNKKNVTGVHYTIKFLGNHDRNGHMTLEQVAEKLYELGLDNADPFKNGVNTKMLKDLGFEQIESLQEPNIKDIGWMLEDGFYQYKFEIDENHIYYGREYDTGGSSYYGSTYQDAFKREYLYVRHSENEKWNKVLYRYINIGSRCVSNYVGD